MSVSWQFHYLEHSADDISSPAGTIRNFSLTTYAMNARISTPGWDGVERRSRSSCRRNSSERRQDPRRGPTRRRSLQAWLRSVTRGRPGVDRRKGAEQRLFERRCSDPHSLLTQEELEALLRSEWQYKRRRDNCVSAPFVLPLTSDGSKIPVLRL